MLPTFCKFLAVFCILAWQTHATGNLSPGAVGVHRRFEYKYSFKPPYLAQKDGTVPFWEYGGSKFCCSTSVVLALSPPFGAARASEMALRLYTQAICLVFGFLSVSAVGFKISFDTC